MAIAAVFEFPGGPIEKYHKVFKAGPAIADQPSRLYHVCYRTQDGFTVIDIWADEESFAASARPSARRSTTQASTPGPPFTRSNRS